MNRQVRARTPERLRAFFEENPRLALAFSGGCDSAYLLCAASACGAELGVYYVRTAFQPAFELEDARRLCRELGQELRVLEVDALADGRVRENSPQRCYFCKRNIFGAILEAAARDGFTCVMDGTNASDDAGDRPGMRALREMRVRSPLRECGIAKADVRALSREAGLFTWNKPAYACLATRVPTGTPIDAAALRRVERGEAALAALGFSDFRVRLTPGGCRLELTEVQMPLLLEKRAAVVSALEADFPEVTLNLKPRGGLEI